MKIVLIQHLGFINGQGGTEKICSFLANGFAALGYEVIIATNENIAGGAVFPLHENVTLTNIYTPDSVQYNLRHIYRYKGENLFLKLKYKVQRELDKAYNRKIYRKFGNKDAVYKFNLQQRSKVWNGYLSNTAPDIIITMSLSAVLEINYYNPCNIPIINSTNGRPDYDYTDILWYRSPVDIQLLKASYKYITAIQVLFSSYIHFLPDTFRGKYKVIANPVPQVSNQEIVNHLTKKDRYKIVQIASLVTSKQQDIAIAIFANIATKYPDWDLYFWGTGFAFDTLTEKIKKANLQQRIFLKGFTDTPLEKLKEADIFIFPSKFEGFPLALTEAMAVGLPSLGFSTCSGVNELIKHNENGFLANDPNEMQQYLEQLICSPELRSYMGANAHNGMKAYSPEIISNQWKDLVSEIIFT
jgi:glycosyltransferase involved in cell wall biosynthesis